MNENNKSLDCSKCKYFHVTWDKHFPKGCKLFGFKSTKPPSITVFEATGKKCENFIMKVKK